MLGSVDEFSSSWMVRGCPPSASLTTMEGTAPDPPRSLKAAASLPKVPLRSFSSAASSRSPKKSDES